MVRRSVGGLLAVDFFIQGYRISGHISTRTHSVADQLNDTLRSYLRLQDVYLSRINRPADIIATYARAELRKANLLFAIVPARESLAKATRSISYFGRQRLPVWVGLPTFEIEGEVLASGISIDVEAFLAENPGDYVTILDGIARTTDMPDIRFSGEAMLVNQRCIDLFCLGKSSS
ncbi:MAG: hypothetical protein JXA09_14715 [Anaerolineae bacterium]|nr:hypothetical protein [Anaerolineae bacterium]